MPSNRTEYMREYFLKHKDHILDTMNVVVECECGKKVKKSLLNKHKRGTKHIMWQLLEERKHFVCSKCKTCTGVA